MIVTLTPRTDFSPVPRVEVRIQDAIEWDGGDPSTTGPDTFDGGDPSTSSAGFDAGTPLTIIISVPDGADSISLYRTCAGREMKVRGAVNRPYPGGFGVLDYEAPFESASYVAEFAADGVSLGRVALGSVTLPWDGPADGVVLQQPLDPHLNAVVRNMSGSWQTITRAAPGATITVEGAVYPSLVSAGPRMAIEDASLDFEVSSRGASASVWGTLGSENDPQLPVWLIRSPNRGLLPPVFFCHVAQIVESDIAVTVPGLSESISRFAATVTEIAPPAPGLVIAALSYEDLDVSFESYVAMDVEFSDYNDKDTAWQYAGAAG